MITIFKQEQGQDNESKDYITGELRGLSTDDKPTSIGEKYIGNGTMFIEIDTGKIYLFDLDSKTWKEI